MILLKNSLNHQKNIKEWRKGLKSTPKSIKYQFFLFSNSINGSKVSGAAYSIIESAKMNGLKPYEYIEYILTRMTGNKLTADLLEEIMPWSEELPKNLYKNKKA